MLFRFRAADCCAMRTTAALRRQLLRYADNCCAAPTSFGDNCCASTSTTAALHADNCCATPTTAALRRHLLPGLAGAQRGRRPAPRAPRPRPNPAPRAPRPAPRAPVMASGVGANRPPGERLLREGGENPSPPAATGDEGGGPRMPIPWLAALA